MKNKPCKRPARTGRSSHKYEANQCFEEFLAERSLAVDGKARRGMMQDLPAFIFTGLVTRK